MCGTFGINESSWASTEDSAPLNYSVNVHNIM